MVAPDRGCVVKPAELPAGRPGPLPNFQPSVPLKKHKSKSPVWGRGVGPSTPVHAIALQGVSKRALRLPKGPAWPVWFF